MDEFSEFTGIEKRLRQGASVPNEGFVRSLEAELLQKSQPLRSKPRHGRPAIAGIALASGVAAMIFAAGLVSDVAPGGGDSATATGECRFVPEKHRVREPVVVADQDGQPRVSYEERSRTRFVERCR